MTVNREEIKKLIGGIVIAYPNYKPQNMEMTVMLWEDMLSDYSYQECMVGLKTYIATDRTGFAPSIGALIDCINKITTRPSMAETEAWALVSKALRNSTYNSQSEFSKLPDAVKQAVGSPQILYQWAVDENFNEAVVSSNFMRSYKSVVKRNEEFARLPSAVKEVMRLQTKEKVAEIGTAETT